MAPELFESPAVLSKQSDMWSCGMLFFELASREIPFHEATSKAHIIYLIKNERGKHIPPECLREAPEFGEIMQRCWREKNARPSAEQLIPELEKLARSPSAAKPY